MKICPLSLLSLLSLSIFFSHFRFFSRTTEPISTKLGTNHSCVKGIQVYSNEGPRSFPRADYNEIAKIHRRIVFNNHWANFQVLTKHSLVKGNYFFLHTKDHLVLKKWDMIFFIKSML